MRKVKVAHVITRLDRGGAPDVVLSIVSGLNPERYQTKLISGLTHEPPTDLESRLKVGSVQLVFIRSLRRNVNPILDICALVKLYHLFKRERFDLVHTHTAKAGALGRIAARLARVPIVIHAPHGHDFYGYFGPVRSRLIVWIERLLGPLADKLIALSELDKKDHCRFGVTDEAKMEVVYSGIDIESFSKLVIDRAKKREELEIPSGCPIVGMIARLEPIKGPGYFIEAASIVIKEVPEARFLVVGDGSLRRTLERLAENLGLSQKLKFMGERQDIREILKVLDLLCLCSLNEGFGRILVEAQAAGKPVVATRVGGIPEVVGDGETGLLVPPSDAPGLAEAIIRILRNPEMAMEMGEAGRRRVSLKFDQKVMLQKIVQMYERLIGEKVVSS